MTETETETTPRTDVETFLAGLDSPNHSEQSRRDWVGLFYRDLRAEATRTALEDIAERVRGLYEEPGDVDEDDRQVWNSALDAVLALFSDRETTGQDPSWVGTMGNVDD